MKILILNWRDLLNSKSGGAEVITTRYALSWIKRGHQVWWISNEFSKSKKSQKVDGINYLRFGPALDGHWITWLWKYPFFLIRAIMMAKRLIAEKKIDLVIDEIHGLPFFTPLFCKIPKVLLVCEVAGPIWHRMYRWPINWIGFYLERFIYQFYKNIKIWAISQNTKADILAIIPKANVDILPLGIDPKLPKKISIRQRKFRQPTAIFVARLVKMKGIELAIESIAEIKKQLPDIRLLVIGRGEELYENSLKTKVISLNLSQHVQFLGYVDESTKYELMGKSHFLLHPSYKEGFGLTVLEAGLVETAAIVKGGSSLDELINSKIDGWVVKSASQMGKAFIRGYQLKKYRAMGRAARRKALNYSWSKILRKKIRIEDLHL